MSKLQLLNNVRWWKTICLIAMMSFVSATAFAQNVTLKGTVVDEKGEPLTGATIKATGTTIAVTADIQGNFSLSVPAATNSITISFIGYSDIEQRISTSNPALGTIKMSTNSKSLNEVVVIGYGTQRREAVTGSVASIGGESLREVPSPNISQALQGRLAGVDISQTNSKPGATTQILIRGQRSLTASNDPLIVLDGIPFVGNLADINPTDIKSIDVLKDASATAIYGSRGANGVILVTTNRGQQGAPARVSYNAYYGIQTLFARYPMMNGPEFVALRKAAGLFVNSTDEADNVDTDWQKLLYRNGAVNSHDVGISGGSEGGSYNFGLGYYQNRGLIPTQQYTRYSLRGSVDQTVAKHFRVGFTTNTNYNLTEGNQVGIYNNLSTTPIANPYNADGSLKRTVKLPLDENYVLTKDVVNGLKDRWLSEQKGFASYNSVYGEVKIPWVEGLKARVNLGLDYVQRSDGNYTGVGVNSVTLNTQSTASIANQHTYHWVMENLLTYDRTFAKKHNLNVVALYSAEQSRFNRSSVNGRDLPNESFQYYNVGSALGEVTADGSYNQWGLLSYMARANYAYDNKYFLSAAIRSDGSSRLAPGHKWNTYPAISVGWAITEESFMKKYEFVNNLKLRAGYGRTSNQSVNPYQTLGSLQPRYYNFGDSNYQSAYYVNQLSNNLLGWEFSETYNFGLDFTLFNRRLSGTVEYYESKTKDLLLSVTLPPTSGVDSYTGNVGQTQNKGLEVSLNGTILDNVNGWTWDLGFNVYINRNKLISLASGRTRDENNGWFVGHNINSIFDYKKVGLWQQGDPYLSTLEPGGNVGMIKVAYNGTYDATGKPTRPIGADDRYIMDVDPQLQGGLNTRVAYKGFDLSIVGAFRKGGILISSLYSGGGYLNMLTGRRNNIKVDYWTPDNTDAKYPKPGGIQSGDNPKYASTLGYFDGSFLKIRTITLGYDVKRLLPKDSKMKIRTYFTVQNPFVMFSPYYRESGMDPETNSYGNENAAVPLGGGQRRLLTIGTNSPSIRSFILGLNVSF